MLLFLAPLVRTHCFAVTFLSPLCLLLRPILKFWSVVGTSLMKFTSANIYPSERFRSQILVWHATTFVNLTRWIGFKIDDNFGGSISWTRNPIVVWWSAHNKYVALRVTGHCKQRVAPFYHASNTSSLRLLHFCHHSFWTFLWGCSSTWRCAYEHFSPNLQSLMVL